LPSRRVGAKKELGEFLSKLSGLLNIVSKANDEKLAEDEDR
jgi:hypothetical protein